MFVLSLIPRGRPHHPRYLVANQHRQFWTGDGWCHDEQAGLLFANETEVAWACAEILTEHSKDKPVFRFVAPVEIEIRSEEPPAFADIYAWLLKATRLFADYKQCGNGPTKDGVVLLSIDWSQLKEIEDE